MSKPKSNVSDLLAAIKRQPTNATPEKTEDAQPVKQSEIKKPARQETPKKVAAEKRVKGRMGKPVQFWMYDEELKLVRELSAWLAGQGVRPSDSLIIRSALRLAKTGSGLLEACSQAAKLDGRLRHE
jgi:hypothetical protein